MFIETPRFPDNIARWMKGGSGWQTIVVETYGGQEYRNAAWAQPKGRWQCDDAQQALNSNSAYYYTALRNLWMVVMGQLGGFRMKDYFDYLDEGGGKFSMIDATHFQCVKRYTVGSTTFDRTILKPVSPIVVTGGSGVSVDYTTGIVPVSSGTPTAWTGAFDIPVRFEDDLSQMMVDSTGALFDWQMLRLIELRNLS